MDDRMAREREKARGAGNEALWAVIDVGCHECGVDSRPVGLFRDKEAASAAADQCDDETDGWRDGGQTSAAVFAMRVPD